MLAHMIATDEDALICDLAQYYGVLDYERLPAPRVAVLSCGLPSESRIMRRLSGCPYSLETQIYAGMYDRLGALVYAQTKDARRGRNKPKSLLAELIPQKDTTAAFKTVNEFEAAREKVLKKRSKP